jgi:hypothetical protein
MAGTGPAPKDPSQRRRRNEPARGEWFNLPPLKGPFLPPLPKRAKDAGVWSARTRRAWAAWRKDPATQMYSEAEVDSVIDLAYVHEEWVRGDNRLISEVRLRMDGLGLTPKGKKDLRWKVIDELPPPPAEAMIVHTASSRERLRAVDPTSAANN